MSGRPESWCAGHDWWREGDRLERLAALWPDRSISAEKIGVMLGCTKSAVIAMAHRQNLGTRDPDYQRRPLTMRVNAFEGLKPDDCRWPIGHPPDAGFHFCGAPATGDGPYCGHHRAIAYVRPAKATP